MRVRALVLLALVGCGARTGLDERDAAAGAVDVAPSNDAARLVFTLYDGRGGMQLYVLDVDGGEARPVPIAGGWAVHATFTPDRRHVVYVVPGRDDGDMASLVVMDLRTRATRTLARAPSMSSMAISPDGRSVVYTAGLNLRVVGWDGAGDRMLVQGPFNLGCCGWGFGHPAFARDAATVFYATAGRIESIGLDGRGRRLLVTGNFLRVVYPNVAVSADGARLAAGIACGEEGQLRAWSIDALPAACETGEVIATVSRSRTGNEANNPAWGDDDRIAFQQGPDIYVVDASGGEPRNVTAALTAGMGESAAAVFPEWVPRGVGLP